MDPTTRSGPPPLPPTPPLPPAPAAPARRRMHGCLIALIVAAVLLVPVLAILAAIAIPAYQDYVSRAKLSQAVLEAETLKWQVAEFHAGHARCPANGDPGFDAPGAYRDDIRDAVHFIAEADEACAIEIVLGERGNRAVDGGRIWLEYAAGSGEWACSSDLDDRVLPAHCRL